jgi:hypothetical protein
MRDADRHSHHFEEFARFLEAPALKPRPQTDEAVLRTARRNLNPSSLSALVKFLAIQVCAGIVTLAICPQFGLGPEAHNPFLHALHPHALPGFYYLFCGLLFVLFGALISGLASSRRDLKALGRGRYAYFTGYSVSAYLVLLLLGTESFLLVSLFWILGGLSGHLIGFSVGRSIRRMIA